MDWQIKPLSKKSLLSGEAFTPGERIVCFLFREASGELERADIRETEVDRFPQPETVLGSWHREVKAKQDEEREARNQVLASSEELFLSLFQESPDGAMDDSAAKDKEVLKQLLGLMLERKRIIKPFDGASDGFQLYRHTKTKQEFLVSTEDFQPQQLLQMQEALQALIL